MDELDVGLNMFHLLKAPLILSFLLAFAACNKSKTVQQRELKSGGWMLVEHDKSPSGEKELQVYATAENPAEEITLRFKLPKTGGVRSSSSVGGITILVLRGEEDEYRFDYLELLSQRHRYREDVLISLEPFRIKNSPQASTGQPATRPESKPEGSDKPQTEAEGRSR